VVTSTGLPSRSIRRARPDDAEGIEALYRQLVGDTNVRVLSACIAKVADDPRTLLLVLENDGLLCASALLNFCADVMFESQPFAVVENIVVDSKLRGQGLGTMLLRWIEENCRARDCSKIMLLSGVERSEAHRFFARCGFADDTKKGFVKYRRAFQASQT
jgi:N-acetylglutamate synthase-like GNAT family acetyltransferase